VLGDTREEAIRLDSVSLGIDKGLVKWGCEQRQARAEGIDSQGVAPPQLDMRDRP
jgi:hypothetical protein